MAKKAKNGIMLRTERGISIRKLKIDDRMLLSRRQVVGQHLFTLGQTALSRFWQKAAPYLKSVGF